MKRLILIAALVAPSMALAQDGGSSAEAKSRKGTQMVCRAIKETGSRLSKRKLCLTRDQWAEQKRIMRNDLQEAQGRRNEPQSN